MSNLKTNLESSKYKISRIILLSTITVIFALLMSPFLTPLIMAALVALALQPIVDKFSQSFQRFKGRGRMPALLILGLFFLLTTGPLFFIFISITQKIKTLLSQGVQNVALLRSAEKVYHWFLNKVLATTSALGIDFEPRLDYQNFFSNVTGFLVAQLGEWAARAPEFLISLFVFSLALYYFLTSAKVIKKNILALDILPAEESERLIFELQKGSYIAFAASTLTGLFQALFVAIFALIFGHKDFFLIFLITFIASFIPVLGAAPIAFFLALVDFVNGNYFGAIGLSVTAALAGSLDNILRPYLVSSFEDDVNPIINLLAIIGGILIFGFPGLFLAPVVTRLAYKFLIKND